MPKYEEFKACTTLEGKTEILFSATKKDFTELELNTLLREVNASGVYVTKEAKLTELKQMYYMQSRGNKELTTFS